MHGVNIWSYTASTQKFVENILNKSLEKYVEHISEKYVENILKTFVEKIQNIILKTLWTICWKYIETYYKHKMLIQNMVFV